MENETVIKQRISRISFWFALLLFPLLLIVPSTLFGEGKEVQSLLDLIERRYNQLESFVADFTQSFESKALGRGVEESGKLYVKIPGKMRWDYFAPEKKLAICNGIETWLYLEDDHVVIKGQLEGSNDRSPILSLLSGRADLKGIFQGKILFRDEKEIKMKVWLKEKREDFDYLILTIEQQSFFLTMIELIDPIGNKMIYSFRNISVNVPLDPKLFYFSIPRGAQIKFETDLFP